MPDATAELQKGLKVDGKYEKVAEKSLFGFVWSNLNQRNPARKQDKGIFEESQ